MQPVPVHLQRRVVPKPWGGQNLTRVVGIELPGDIDAVGETWELFDRPDGASALRDFPGVTIADLRRDSASAWIGKRFADVRRWPILVKFLDVADRLSVQVHPDEAMARDFDDGGKNEAWVVLDVAEEGRIVHGLEPEFGRDDLAAAVQAAQSGDLCLMERVLRTFRPSVGDSILVEAGTVHAIGPGVVAFEVQQNSDVTFRLYDWGRSRELHVDDALRAFRPVGPGPGPVGEAASGGASPPTEEGGERLIRHSDFQVDRHRFSDPRVLETTGSFRVLNILAGRATIGWRSGGDDPPLLASAGDTVLVPACIEQAFVSPISRVELLWTGPGAHDDS